MVIHGFREHLTKMATMLPATGVSGASADQPVRGNLSPKFMASGIRIGTKTGTIIKYTKGLKDRRKK